MAQRCGFASTVSSGRAAADRWAWSCPDRQRAADLVAAMTVVAAAAAEGTITPDEALALSQTLEPFIRAFDARKAERRHQEQVAYYAAAAARKPRGGDDGQPTI